MKLYKARFRVTQAGIVLGAYYRDVDFTWTGEIIDLGTANGPRERDLDEDSLEGTITATGFINMLSNKNFSRVANTPESAVDITDFTAPPEIQALIARLGPWKANTGGIRHATRTPSEDRLTLFSTSENAFAAWDAAGNP